MAKTEYEEHVELELLRRQLESAIGERRNAEEEYQELWEELLATAHLDTDTEAAFSGPPSPSELGAARRGGGQYGKN